MLNKIILFIAFAVIFSSVSAYSQKPVQLKTHQDSIAYSLGLNLGQYVHNNILKDSLELNKDILFEGVRSGLYKQNQLLTDQEMQSTIQNFQQEQMQIQQMKAKESADRNKATGQIFLEKNKKEAGVKVTPSGLQYKVIKEGKGKKPTTENIVKVHYTGKLIDGKVFDSSVERGEPIEFPVTGVIKGWTEGLQLMSEGSKFMFYIPADLGYGDRGAPPAIEPGATLIFEVELLEVKEGGQQANPQGAQPTNPKKK